jgi:hypothetical protein
MERVRDEGAVTVGWVRDEEMADPDGSAFDFGLPDVVDAPEDPGLFRRYSMVDVLSEPDDFEWLIGGLMPDPTYGQAAGEMKTLKSTITGFIEVGLASGVPIFGRFAPRTQRPVLAYVGEGGRRLWTRRIRRISSAMGVNPADLDMHPVFDIAPIPSPIFQESLLRDLDQVAPGLVTLDPLYTYHGTATRASDLHQEGALLNQLSTPCMKSGASLLVVNHMNQTGSGMSLKRITMAGSGEWADSWLLVAHREDPVVDAGLFRLTLEVGSRQWGGTTWDLDLDIGRFDEETGSHDGQISWDLCRATASSSKRDTAASEKGELARKRILDALFDRPWAMTRTEIRSVVGGSRALFDSTFDGLTQTCEIAHDMRGRDEAGTTKKRLLWGLTPTRPDTSGPGWDKEVD